MKHVVITIGREYGSGGRLIAKQLSEELGITFYDKELITAVARKTGFSENFIRDSEHQRPTNSFLYDLYTAVQTPSVPDQVFIAQAKVIKEAASRESCVIVGRCSDYILGEDPACIKVFIHADMASRIDTYKKIAAIQSREEADDLIRQVETFAEAHRARTGTRLVWCSDEFYLLAGRELPPEEYFEEFTQLDNGVGMLTLLSREFARGLDLMEPEEMEGATPFAIATGVSAAPFLEQLVARAREKCGAIRGTVYPIRNDFFGHTITVAGLVTGGDLIAQLRGRELGQRLLIPANMLRAGERVFLDDVSLDDVERELGVPVIPVAQDGFELLDAVCGLEVPPPEQVQLREETEYFQYR